MAPFNHFKLKNWLIMLKIMKIPVSFSNYKDAMMTAIKRHAIGKLFLTTEGAMCTWRVVLYILNINLFNQIKFQR